MSESKLKAQEVSCQAAVSSTVKRTELDEISNFKIGNMTDNPKNNLIANASNDGSEIQVQSSSSPISTTQIITSDDSPKTSPALDVGGKTEKGSTHNISNADTTTVQGIVNF